MDASTLIVIGCAVAFFVWGLLDKIKTQKMRLEGKELYYAGKGKWGGGRYEWR